MTIDNGIDLCYTVFIDETHNTGRNEMNSMYVNVTNYEADETLEPIVEKIVTARTGNADYRTVYVPKGSRGGCAIPTRNTELKLDLSKVAEAQAHANQIRFDLAGE